MEAHLKTRCMLGTGKGGDCFPLLRHHFEHLYGADGSQKVLQLNIGCGWGEALYGHRTVFTLCTSLALSGGHRTSSTHLTTPSTSAPARHNHPVLLGVAHAPSASLRCSAWSLWLLSCHGNLPLDALVEWGCRPGALLLHWDTHRLRPLSSRSWKFDDSDFLWHLLAFTATILCPLHYSSFSPRFRSLSLARAHWGSYRYVLLGDLSRLDLSARSVYVLQSTVPSW